MLGLSDAPYSDGVGDSSRFRVKVLDGSVRLEGATIDADSAIQAGLRFILSNPISLQAWPSAIEIDRMEDVVQLRVKWRRAGEESVIRYVVRRLPR